MTERFKDKEKWYGSRHPFNLRRRKSLLARSESEKRTVASPDPVAVKTALPVSVVHVRRRRIEDASLPSGPMSMNAEVRAAGSPAGDTVSHPQALAQRQKANVISMMLMAGELAYDTASEPATRKYAVVLFDELLRVAARYRFTGGDILRGRFLAGDVSDVTMRMAVQSMRWVPLEAQLAALDRAAVRLADRSDKAADRSQDTVERN